MKADRLVTWGPYGWIRNPLYLANGLMGLGCPLRRGAREWGSSWSPSRHLPLLTFSEEAFSKAFGDAFRLFKATSPAAPPADSRAERRRGPFDGTSSAERAPLSMVTLAATALLLSRLVWLGASRKEGTFRPEGGLLCDELMALRRELP